ncbi:MAG: hypothetical protein K8R53_10960, partial [Bacteroidales bacterium]|nr:hypothetical protein [Bacteroidales bacterium]
IDILGGFTFDADVILNGTLRNHSGNYYNLTVTGSFENNGTVTDNTNYNLTLYLDGDVFNHGTWTNYYTYLAGADNQVLEFSQPFGCLNLEVSNTDGNIQANCDLEFVNTNFNLSNDTLILKDPCHQFKMDGGYLQSGKVIKYPGKTNALHYQLDNSAYMQAVQIYNESYVDYFHCANNSVLYTTNIDANWVIFSGDVFIQGFPMIINGDVNVNGNLSNYITNNATLDVNGNLVNNGNISNNNYNYHLYIYVDGDITNHGIWNNTWTQLNGLVDQHINLVNGQAIDGQIRLLSDIGGSFEWFYNGGTLIGNPDFSGATSVELKFLVPVSLTYAGIFNCSTNQGPSRDIIISEVQQTYYVFLKGFLEGPFSGTEMNNTLTNGGYVPLSQPYNTLPWNYNGTEAVTSFPSPEVVDWILVEFRDAPDASSALSGTVIDRQAAFVLNNGNIVDVNGNSLMQFSYNVNHQLFAILWHRNHVGIMSAFPLLPSAGIYGYDFTTAEGQVYGGINGHVELTTGIWGMAAGDGNADSQINNLDKNDVWAVEAGSSGYYSGDFNMDSQVNNSDKNDMWIPNTGFGGQIPN